MKLLRHLYNEASLLLGFACLFAMLSGLCGTALIQMISKGMTGNLAAEGVVLKFLGLIVLLLVAKVSAENCMVRVTQDAALKMRVRLSRKLVAAPYVQVRSIGKSGLLAILTKDIDGFARSLELAPSLLTNTVVIVVCFSYMAWLAWPLALFLAVVLVVLLPLFHLAQRSPRHQFKLLREQMDLLYKHFRSLVEASRELHLDEKKANEFVEKIIAPDARDYRKIAVRGASRYSMVANTGDMLFYVIIGLMLFLVPRWSPQSAQNLSIITMLLLYMIGPISAFINFVPAMAHAGIALERIQQLDNDLIDTSPGSSASADFSGSGTPLLELRALVHQYKSEKGDKPFALGPLNVTVHAGETVFIAGGNGSGKTTLAMLLLGLYAPDAGQIRLRGHLITEANIRAYRQNFSAIFYDFHLLENLLGVSQEGRTEAEHLIERFGLSHRVAINGDKFSTIDLSSGQKRRLALIMAYLEDKPIYVFDEWAADQDPAFKRIFYTELLPELKSLGKTVFVISHDDDYYHCADRILYLKEGGLHESDTVHPEPVAAYEFAASRL